MTDEASRAGERFGRLQRWTGARGTGERETGERETGERGTGEHGAGPSWFSNEELGAPDEQPPPPQPQQPDAGVAPGGPPSHPGRTTPPQPSPPQPGASQPGPPQQAQQGGQQGGADPRASTEQRYAEAIATMNEIVSTLDFGQLPRVTETFRVTASVLRHDDPARAGVLNNLGSAAQLTHLRSGDLVDLEDAISYYRSASSTAHADDQDLVLYRCNLVLALGEYAAKADSPDTAAEGVRVARDTAENTPRRDQRRAMALIRLANALKLHARLADDADSDGESVEVFREAARISPAREAATSELLINLGAALLRRYERDSAVDDLDEGIKHLGSGAGALADGEPRRDRKSVV